MKLAAICLNPVACVCQTFMMVKPSWLESLPDETSKCRSGDVFTLLVERILVMIVEMSEGIVNEYVMSFLRNALGFIGVDVNDICLPFSSKLCPSDPKMLEAMFGCSPDHKDAHTRCFYERQRAVCLGKDDSRDRYEALFDSPSASELERQFRSIVGDTYESIPPAMMQAFKDADASTTGYNRAAASLCDNSLVDSMSLDDIILSCVFHNIETFCPGSQDDDELDTYVKTIDWKLPKVRWHYFSSPPPPPPVSFGAFHDLVAADPDGMELLREMLLDAFPSLTHVASQTYGSNVGREYSPNGIGYGPVYHVSRYTMSTAFLATAHFRDQDSLSARIVQARFTGMFRFSCKALKDFMTNPETAAAGTASGSTRRPDDYTACARCHRTIRSPYTLSLIHAYLDLEYKFLTDQR